MKKVNQKPPVQTKIIQKKEILPLWILPLILIFTFIVFSPSLKNEMINTWDDGVYITENSFTAKLSGDNIKTIFTKPIANNYNPLPIFTFAIIRSVVGLDPFLYHLVNIIFHLVCVSLVFWMMRLMKQKISAILFVTVLFAIHTMRVESVTWITELKDVMFASFYFAALITYLYWRKSENAGYSLYLLMIVFAVLSLLSKIQAVSLPLSMLAIDYLQKREWKLSVIIEKIPFFILSAITGLVGMHFLSEGGSLEVNEEYSIFERLLWACYALGNYFVKLILPVGLSAYYPPPVKVDGLFPVLYYIVPFILLAGAVWIYLKYRSNRIILFGLLFFIVNIMFVLQVVGAGKAYMADRFTYVAYFGLFFIGGNALAFFADKYKSRKQLIVAAAGVYIVILSVLTWQRTRVWENSGTLWSDCINKYPNAFVAYDNRGVYYRSIKQDQKALNDYSKVLELNPSYALTYNNRANVYFENGMDDLALADYNKSIQLDSTQVKTITNRAIINFRKREYQKAEADFAKAISIDSTFDMIYFNRGLFYDNLNRSELAIADFRKYLSINPRHDGIHNSVGVSYQKLGQHQNSIEYFSKAIELNPQQPIFWQNRSYSYNALSQPDKARNDINKAIQLGLKADPAYLNSLGIAP